MLRGIGRKQVEWVLKRYTEQEPVPPDCVKSFPLFSSEDVIRILKNARVTLKQRYEGGEAKLAALLTFIAFHYTVNRDVFSIREAPKQKALFERIRKHATDLSSALEQLDTRSHDLFLRRERDLDIEVWFRAWINPFRDVFEILRRKVSPEGKGLNKLRRNLLALAQRAEVALELFPESNPVGAKKKGTRTVFIAGLAFLYYGFTGHPPRVSRNQYLDGEPCGPFFTFVDECFKHIGEPMNPETLRTAIRPAIEGFPIPTEST